MLLWTFILFLFFCFYSFYFSKVWFQNQRAKWKKKKKTPATGNSGASPGTSSTTTSDNYSDFGGNETEHLVETNWLLNTNLNIANDWNPETFDMLLT